MTNSEFAGQRVMVESPYRNGNRANNLRYLAWCEYDCAKRGELPISSHGNCTQYWPEDDVHREMGFMWRDAYAQTCAAVAFYIDLGELSDGAKRAKERDALAGRVTLIRSLLAADYRLFALGSWPPGTMRKVPAGSDPRLAMVDDISLLAQEWAELDPIGQGVSAPEFMRRICDVLGTTYGRESATTTVDEAVERAR